MHETPPIAPEPFRDPSDELEECLVCGRSVSPSEMRDGECVECSH